MTIGGEPGQSYDLTGKLRVLTPELAAATARKDMMNPLGRFYLTWYPEWQMALGRRPKRR
jgi:hypothetical protein